MAGRGSIGYSGEMGELRVLGKNRESAGKTGARPPRLERFGLAIAVLVPQATRTVARSFTGG